MEVLYQSDTIINSFINDIKVDFVSTPYPFISEHIEHKQIKLASLIDIGAMKLSAITGRGSKKDFIDIHFLLKHFRFEELLGFFNQKYTDASEFLLYKSLLYFEDAEGEPMPKMNSPIEWHQVKASIQSEVKKKFP